MKKSEKPFGIRFLETPSAEELREINGGRAPITPIRLPGGGGGIHVGGGFGGLHSMDIIMGPTPRYNT